MFVTIVVAFLVILFLYHVKKIRLYCQTAKFPGPLAFPVIGSAYHFIGDTEDILSGVVKLLSTYPSPFRVWLGTRLFIPVYEPEQLKIVLTSPKTIEKEDLYSLARPWLGTGLFTAPAEKWKVHRKLIAPTFNMKILESFVDVFVKQGIVMTNEMKKELNGGEFEVFEYVSLCTLDIVCETAMGVEVKAQKQKNSLYIHAAKRIFEIIMTRMFNIWLHPEFVFSRTKLGDEQRKCVDCAHALTDEVIKKKKLAEAKIDANENSYAQLEDIPKEDKDKSTKMKAFLDLLMELSKDGTKLSHEELRDEVDTMMIAGNETTATVNTYVMLMLALHPEIQEKVFEELCGIYGDEIFSDTPIKAEDLNRMEYLERVIKETMRIFPVGAIIVRKVTDDLDIGGQILPKDSSALIGIIATHRLEKYWPDPMKFDPDRFLPEEVAKRHAYSYIPFSGGPRNCLGMRYAMMAMKVLLATVLRHYVLKKDKMMKLTDIKLKLNVVLKTVEPIKLRIEPRQR